ncbi:MAG: hypothetical protein IJL76_03755 [Bacilli bacterium]|nr:hypothetical protein [Bacilli bacterium]
MHNYLESVDEKIKDTRKNLDRYIEGKNVLEKIIAYKEIVDGFKRLLNLDLYVEVNGLNEMDFDTLDEIKVYTEESIKSMLDDPNEVADMYLSKYEEYLDIFDSKDIRYTDIFITSYNDGVFLKYDKYMEGLLKLWKAKYLDDVNLVFPLIKFHNERKDFIKTITEDDIYPDVITIRPGVSAWYHDYDRVYKRSDDYKISPAVINVNDFVEVVKDRGLEVYFNNNDYIEDTAFDSIVTYQKEGPFYESLSVVYDKPLDYKPKRLVK